MNCMKCGRENKANQAFCDGCLAEMEKYPVRPDVAVQLPHRPETQPPRKTHQRKRQALTAEEQLAVMKKRYRHLLALLLAMFLLVIGLGVLAGTTIRELDVQKLLGRNYSTVSDDTSADQPMD